jgi:hypothetical protein
LRGTRINYAIIVAFSDEDEGYIATIPSVAWLLRIRGIGGGGDQGGEDRRLDLALRGEEGGEEDSAVDHRGAVRKTHLSILLEMTRIENRDAVISVAVCKEGDFLEHEDADCLKPGCRFRRSFVEYRHA